MKNITLILFVLMTCIVMSCKKEKNTITSDEFDINNPFDYILYIDDLDGLKHTLVEFLPNNKLNFYEFESGGLDTSITTYEIVGKNTLLINNEYTVVLDSNKISFSDGSSVETGKCRLIKIPATNQLLGKTFSGKYYNYLGVIKYNNYFYAFNNNIANYEAGFIIGQTKRLTTYTNLFNIASYATLPNTINSSLKDEELLILIDNKLITQYADQYYKSRFTGTFTEM